MLNENRLFNDANSLFFQKRFEEALVLYSELCFHFPQKDEYRIYALLCDIAFEDVNKAISLYDYFSILKEENKEEAIKYVEDTIDAYDGNIEKMMNILKDINDSNIEQLDAIKYEEFKKIIEKRGSFKRAFEDIMFSTKVAIDSKVDFYDFVNNLIDNGFDTTAYTYLEGFNEYFSFDKEIEELFKKLEKRQNEANHKR
ncbi:hypothetical protein [Arcobacter porcinus]|uniref:Tetratricopeptide repeat protein n=1 Tax=Arcobacter porcinus TaxID=1935204 RepID=A0A1C0B1E7_9BACT|nr:hypothetical protein [Arcobacter porcinus]OCL89863.1 hypothetical protein AAX27_01678 [Aliarcobacter thereius]OCL82981.1 hypothetical protein AAW30_01050 [Arcobacter porcinus]OCL88931.1 hypothetical protein AAX30_00055 [Arcobacter porcinus]OCL93627.1 hypothetical protein AAX28_01178 [Arcobacter porcinus]QEP40049.1 hypothetical protein APORC_0427 [Arcobacter porcinus]